MDTKITINEFGLYKNKVARKYIPGLKSNEFDNQTQGWWLPMYDKEGSIHLVDTYHISSHFFDTEKVIENFIEMNENKQDNSWAILKSNSEYYYGGSVKMNQNTEKYFDEICDLRYFRISNADIRDYEEKDYVTNVQLYSEHCYPYGVTLLRRSAQINDNYFVKTRIKDEMNSINSSSYPWNKASYWRLCRLRDMIKNNTLNVSDKTKEELDLAIYYLQLILKFKKGVDFF